MGQDPLVAAKAKPENHSASRRREGKRVSSRGRRRETLYGRLGWAYAKQCDNFICRCSGNTSSCLARGHKQGVGQGQEVQHVAPYELRLSNAVKCVKNV